MHAGGTRGPDGVGAPYAALMTREDDNPVGLSALDQVSQALRRAGTVVLALREQRLRRLGMATAHYALRDRVTGILRHTRASVAGRFTIEGARGGT